MKKSKKKSITRVNKGGVLSIIPVRKYDYALDAFVLTDGRYMGIEKIIARDIENMSDDELDMELLNLIKIYKTALFDIKFVSMNFPLNTQKQKDVLLKHKEKTKDSVKLRWINRQIDELDRAESGVLTREFYIFYFGKNKSAYEKNKELLSKYMGSGKSTHLKKLFKHSASIGNYIRVFDVSGEFASLTNEFGGKIIRCSGREGMLNPLEILRAGENDEVSYANHISKLQTFFKCIIPSMDDILRQELANQLRTFYAAYNLTPENDNQITGREAVDYPILTDFKNYLIQMINKIKNADELALTDVETNLNIEKARNLSSLLGAVENLINNYGSIFNGHSAINNITSEQIVCFDISSIKDLGDIFAAQMQILVSLCWDNAVSNGTKMKERWESEDGVESTDITKFLVLIDESHRWINTSMPQILDMILRYMREARKFFAGIVLASQSVRDFMPESTGENIEKIKQLFELSQYKFMFKQDSSVKEHIKNKFSFELTMSQVDRIPILEVGETILSIAGDCSIEFKEWLSKDYEEKLFAGGR